MSEERESLTLSFPNSPTMDIAAAENKTKEANEAAVKADYQREMENIAEHGPLDRTKDHVMEAEEQEISDLAAAGKFDEIKTILHEQLTEIEADPEDYDMLDYYSRFLDFDDPESRSWAMQMSILTMKHLRRMKG